MEARPGACRRQRHRLQALGADARSRPSPPPPASTTCRPGWSTSSPVRATSAPRSSPTSGSTASPSPARSRPASGSRRSAPSGSPGSTSRWAARTPSSSAPTSPTRSTSRPAAAPGRRSSTPARSAPRPSASTSLDDVYDDYLQAFADHTRTPADRRPDGPGDRRRPDGLRRPAREGRRPGRGGGGGRRRGGRRRRLGRPRPRATSSPPPWSPGRRPTPTCSREETFGPVAPLVRVRSLDEAIELANSTRFGLGANVYTEDLKTMLRCMREIKAGTVWFNDPLTDNDAGPVRRLQAVGPRPRARARGTRSLPGDQARPHRDRDRSQGMVVPVLAY